MGRPRKDANNPEGLDFKEQQMELPGVASEDATEDDSNESIGNKAEEPVIYDGYLLGILKRDGQYYVVQAEATLEGKMGNFKRITDERNEGSELARERFKLEASSKVLT